jgi:hypothetical protein
MAALFGRKKTTVGLDIGSGLIKVAVIDHTKPLEPELTRVAIVPLLADAIVEGEIMDPGIGSEAITGALTAAGVTSKDVHVDVYALGLAEPHGPGIGTAAEELLPKHRRELARPTDREHVLPAPRALDLQQQPPKGRERDRRPDHY